MSRSARPCPGTLELPCREQCEAGEGCAIRARMLPGVLTGPATSVDDASPSTRLTTAVDKRRYVDEQPPARVDAVAMAWHDVTCPEALTCRSRALHALSAPLPSSGVLDRFLTRLAELGRQHA